MYGKILFIFMSLYALRLNASSVSVIISNAGRKAVAYHGQNNKQLILENEKYRWQPLKLKDLCQMLYAIDKGLKAHNPSPLVKVITIEIEEIDRKLSGDCDNRKDSSFSIAKLSVMKSE